MKKNKLTTHKNIFIIVLRILLLSAMQGKVSAQKNMPLTLNPKLQGFAKGGSNRNWIDFREGTAVNPLTVFADLKDAFELKAEDQMKMNKAEKDDLGMTHYRYRQYYKNLEVIYGEYVLHQQKDSMVRSANGRIINGLKLGNVPSVSEKNALASALRFMDAVKYLWQNTSMESQLRGMNKDDNATYFPKGSLVYAPDNDEANFAAEDYRLAWKFTIYTDDPKVTAKIVYVDALTGNVIHHTDIAMNCSAASGISAYNGKVSFNTQAATLNAYYSSHNDCQATNIYVFNCNGGAAGNTLYADFDNVWTDQSAVQAQFGAQATYNYYKSVHGRTSWDNAAGDMIAYNNAYAGSNNACWGCNGNNTIFYAGNTSAANDDWNTDDIMGHEFTHGVTQASAGLDYNKESGALNESFSDIFGEMVESAVEGSCDYLVGADRGAIRSLINPKSYGQPDTYLGKYWSPTTACSPSSLNDNCGVHTNSGVQNHWFYLLSEGGSGTNDLGQPYSVTGISRFEARRIAYRALTVYLNSSSQYLDARAATLHAAFDLYGGCSANLIAVGDAWHAVGVESASPLYAYNVCGNYPTGGITQAISQLTVSAGGCTTTITSPDDIQYFAARDRIILYPGFRAVTGSRFIAYPDPCSTAIWKSSDTTSQDPYMSDAEKGIVIPVTTSISPDPTDAAKEVFIAPNPFHSTFQLSINSTEDTKGIVNIFNSFGEKVKQIPQVHVIKGANKISFNGADLKRGVYMVEIRIGVMIIVKKIVKL